MADRLSSASCRSRSAIGRRISSTAAFSLQRVTALDSAVIIVITLLLVGSVRDCCVCAEKSSTHETGTCMAGVI
ncbi:hypothetical protein [Methyloversatilis sp.]|uniref:hypothetical protein n=1 Tax=Methyloversatilis sp. TaxID=2569862 RepID=UPI002732EFD7|nr:hypothetical protein [Methyloversatilis sp.]MDP2868415.1 hypothetical protein [Methyloversatilis sp.]MDP3287486.1 hypothetical protein [Methyloversatilis sp.]MDP3457324.1 hypothetical protein [Methyloversatilis sp.]MDP3578727.1 hypothetical protein [Methyloversatilis sp.]